MTVLTKKITAAEYRALEFEDTDNFQYELLNGEIVKKASPTIQHQRILRRVVKLFEKHLDANPAGELFFAPLDVALDDFNVPQPDVLFVGKERSHIINEAEQVILGPPDLLVEIISGGSIRRDRIEKKDLYEQFGVTEYWIVDPNNRSVEVYRLHEGRYKLFSFAAESGKIQSSVLEGFEVEIAEIFVSLPLQ